MEDYFEVDFLEGELDLLLGEGARINGDFIKAAT